MIGDKKHKRKQAWITTKGHSKKLMNSLAVKLGKPPFFEISQIERMASASKIGFPNEQISALKNGWRWSFHDTTIGWSILLLLSCLILFLFFGGDVSWADASVEWWGLIFDIAVILVGFGFIQYHRQKRDIVARQHELIEDFRRWDSEEARHRILGAIRRLGRQNVHKVNLSGCILKNICFISNGISSLHGSTLSGSNFWDETHTTSTFEHVDFSRMDCREVQFEKVATINQHPIRPSAQYQDCDFWDTDLENSIFDGAALHWSEAAPDDMFETVGEDEYGQPLRSKCVAGRFNEANLAYTSFKGCDFLNADFRDVHCIELANFQGAKGLQTCLFDTEEIMAKVLKQSQEPIHG